MFSAWKMSKRTRVLLVSLTLCCFVFNSTRRIVLCLTLCHFVLVFFSPFSTAITLLGEERANLSAFRTFVRFVLVWICPFPLPLGVWVGLRFVIVDFSLTFFALVVLITSFAIPSPDNSWSSKIPRYLTDF